MPIQKMCEKCGQAFNVPPRRSEEVKFCSRECKTAAGRVSLSCASCSKVFERVLSSRKRSAKDFCSRACFYVAQKGSTHAPVAGEIRHYKVCETCLSQFRVTKTRAETARFCSRKCQGGSQSFAVECSERQQAEKSWRWAGGKYATSQGYIREKRKVLGVEAFTLGHRNVIEAEMVKSAPEHPFLVLVDGVLRLSPSIEVHHIDRDRANNAPSNLLAVTKHAHAQIHHRNRKPEPWECWTPDPQQW